MSSSGDSPFELSSLDSGGPGGYVLEGLGLDERLGARVSPLGDINGDGASDMAVTNQTGVLLFYGTDQPGTITSADIDEHGYTILEDPSVPGIGEARPLGDLDADGFGDFALAAGGCIFVVWGSPTGSPLTVRELKADSPAGVMVPADCLQAQGQTLGVADVDGDGVPDVVAGVPTFFEREARAHVYGLTGG